MRIPLFMTESHPCPYLPGRQARNAVVEAYWSHDIRVASELNRQGFRRSGEFLYRPHCEGCSACEALRIDVTAFQPSRSQRRVQRKNSDLRLIELGSIDNDACFELFRTYIERRHAGGSMHPADRGDYRRFLARPPSSATAYLGIADPRNRLLGVLVYDCLDDGLSDVFSFYDTEYSSRSLGTWMILVSIDLARAQGLPYVYPGFYIASCRKMSYKTRFSSMEVLRDGHWHAFRPSTL